MHVKPLVKHAAGLGMPAIGVTDNHNMFGALEFAMAAKAEGVQPIMGITLRVALQESDVGEMPETGDLVLIAQNEAGYMHLLDLISDSYTEGNPQLEAHVLLAALQGKTEGVIALTGGHESLLNKALQHGRTEEADAVLRMLLQLFPERLYVELQRLGYEGEAQVEQALLTLADAHGLPLVATNDVMFLKQELHQAHDALLCIAGGHYTTEEHRRKVTSEHYFKTAEEMTQLFADIPEAIANTEVIAKRCSFMPEVADPMLPHFPTEGGRSEEDELRAVSHEGLQMRLQTVVYPASPEADKAEIEAHYKERLDFELDIISRMEFPGYFLIVSDFIRWAKREDIPVGPGRGSGAGSLVAWSLDITNLDPIRYGLLFERFLNPERVSMPDFDVDFCQERRDEVIAYVQERYGANHVAQIITFGKLQARAVLRDTGRVLQMPYGQVDRMCKLIPFNPAAPVTLQEAIELDSALQNEAKADAAVADLLDIGLKLEGLYRHASTHAAGVVIGSKPLKEIIPLYTDHRSPIPATQFSMKYSELSGLVKFDFLGLKTLTTIQKAVKLIRAEQDAAFDIEAIPLDDRPTYDLLTAGKTVGVFQMESAGMRDALRKMKPDSLEDIIALISLYRPGPMENIPTYIARKHGKEKPDYLHPLLQPCLEETYGVIIYQEQVMEIAKILGGYSLGQADLLRRAMGKKIKEEMDAQREMFLKGAEEQKVDVKQADSIFDLVAKFAGYGFNKSHAAAYALIGYQTAYLKANYPVEFLTACMNMDIGDTDKLLIYKEESALSGIALLPPDVNKSHGAFTVEALDEAALEQQKTQQLHAHKRGIRFGLGGLKNVGLDAMNEMAAIREAGGAFSSLGDLAGRCTNKIINKRQLESLTAAGAMDSLITKEQRASLFESVPNLVRMQQAIAEEKAANQVNLFGDDTQNTLNEVPLANVAAWTEQEQLQHEYEAIGFYLSNHPMDRYMRELRKSDVTFLSRFSDIESLPAKERFLVAGTVTKLTHRSANGKRFAYVALSDPTATIELSLFSEELLNNSLELLEGTAPICVDVDARIDEGGVRLFCSKIRLLDDYLKHRSYRVAIDVFPNSDVAPLIKELQQLQAGRARVQINLTTANQHHVTIELPTSYVMDDNHIETLQALPIVASVG